MNYRLIYSKRKTVGLSVKGEELIVRAPFGTSEQRIKKILESHKNWIFRAFERERKRQMLSEELSCDDIAVLKASAKVYFSFVTAKYAETMGLKYGRVKITSAKTRFGSCSSDGNICFSYRLMLYPEEAREYVVVHELSHLVHMNHSPAFYALVARYMPDYKRRKALLKL